MNIEGMSTYNPEESKKLDSNHQAEFYNLAQRHQREMAELKKRHQNEMSPHIAVAFAEAIMEGGAEKEKQTTEEHKDKPNDEIKVGNSENISREENEVEKISSQEEAEQQQMVGAVIELIEKGSNSYFRVCINGSLTPTTDSRELLEQRDFYFDREQKKMMPNGRKFETLDRRIEKSEKKFKSYWQGYASSNSISYVVTIPFNPIEKNNFTKEHRAGTHLSFSLDFNVSDLEKLRSEKAKTYLKDWNEKGAGNFLSDVFIACAEKYIPEYWEFYKRQKELYEK